MSDISVRDVAVDLGGRPVLTDVNLTLDSGEFVGIIGPNGAGKTTLLRAIQGLVPLRSGEVLLDGAPLRKHRSQIGYVPQRHEFAWDYPLSVADVAMTGRVREIGWLRSPRRADWAEVARALKLVNMSDMRDRPVGQLSGGQRQRVLVARALTTNPKILLLDEPFTGVDVPTQELLTDLCLLLADQGVTVVMTTHDLVAARHTCPRLCVVNKTIVADSRTTDLDDPQVWMDAFGVSAHSPILTALGIQPRELVQVSA